MNNDDNFELEMRNRSTDRKPEPLSGAGLLVWPAVALLLYLLALGFLVPSSAHGAEPPTSALALLAEGHAPWY